MLTPLFLCVVKAVRAPSSKIWPEHAFVLEVVERDYLELFFFFFFFFACKHTKRRQLTAFQYLQVRFFSPSGVSHDVRNTPEKWKQKATWKDSLSISTSTERCSSAAARDGEYLQTASSRKMGQKLNVSTRASSLCHSTD